MKFKFSKKYFLLAVILFIAEILIAVFVNDSIIRPYGGDFLVVILLYSAVKSFVDVHWFPAALNVLAFAFLIEMLQYLNFIRWVGLERSALARVVLGTSFAWTDILAYTLGILVVMLIERKREKVNKE